LTPQESNAAGRVLHFFVDPVWAFRNNAIMGRCIDEGLVGGEIGCRRFVASHSRSFIFGASGAPL
jgi:hypothetical protein